MNELHLRAGLFVFAVAAAVLIVWLGGGWVVAALIIVAFICAFAAGALPSVTSTISKISRMDLR
jgi:hypothetical protein